MKIRSLTGIAVLAAAMLGFTNCNRTYEAPNHVVIRHNADSTLTEDINLVVATPNPENVEAQLQNQLWVALSQDPSWTSGESAPLTTDDTITVINGLGQSMPFLNTDDANETVLRFTRSYPQLAELDDATPFAIGGLKVHSTYEPSDTCKDCLTMTFTLDNADQLFTVPISDYVSRDDFDYWVDDRYQLLNHHIGAWNETYDTARLDSISQNIKRWQSANTKAAAPLPDGYTMVLDDFINSDTKNGNNPRMFDEETIESFYHAVHITYIAPNGAKSSARLSVADLLYNGGTCTVTTSASAPNDSHLYKSVNDEKAMKEFYRSLIILAIFYGLILSAAFVFLFYLIAMAVSGIKRKKFKNDKLSAANSNARNAINSKVRARNAIFFDYVVIIFIIAIFITLSVYTDYEIFHVPTHHYLFGIVVVALYLLFRNIAGKSVGCMISKTHLVHHKTGTKASRGRAIMRACVSILAYSILLCTITLISFELLVMLPLITFDMALQVMGVRGLADRICGTALAPKA